jgi:hypothetical protein
MIIKKYGGMLLVLLALVAPNQGRAQAMKFPDKIKQLRPAIVEVFVNGKRSGTGFFVSPEGHVVTALHVVAKREVQNNQYVVTYSGKLEVRLHDGRILVAQPIPNTAPDHAFYDMALLKVDGKNLHSLTIGSYDDITEGEESYFMGFPFDTPAAVTYEGLVSAKFSLPSGKLKGVPISTDIVLIQSPVARGFSGAPLLSLANDKVVGVVTTRIGGIGSKLSETREKILQGQKSGGSVRIMGVDPNESILELVNVLDQFLSAGTGWAVSIDHVRDFLAKQDVLKSQ